MKKKNASATNSYPFPSDSSLPIPRLRYAVTLSVWDRYDLLGSIVRRDRIRSVLFRRARPFAHDRGIINGIPGYSRVERFSLCTISDCFSGERERPLARLLFSDDVPGTQKTGAERRY